MSDTMRDATWKLMPVEPNKLMLVKGENALHSSSHGDFHATEGEIEACYSAMLAAAPAPPVPQSVQDITPLLNAYTRAFTDFLLQGKTGVIDAAFKPLQAALTALVEERDRLKFELDGVNAMRRPLEWVSVDEQLPGPGVIVWAFFRNNLGKGRIVRAHHAPKHTIEASHWDDDAEVDETEDGTFEPEGWYEDPAVGENLSFISPESDGVVTYWMKLPSYPSTPGIAPEQGEVKP